MTLIVVQHLTVARVAEGLGGAWNTANDTVLAEGRRALIDDPGRLDGVRVAGVDEHCWRHTRRGDKYVTVIIDLTRCAPARRPPARLLAPLGVLEGEGEHGAGGDRPVRLALQPRRHRPRVHDRVTPLINFDELGQ